MSGYTTLDKDAVKRINVNPDASFSTGIQQDATKHVDDGWVVGSRPLELRTTEDISQPIYAQAYPQAGLIFLADWSVQSIWLDIVSEDVVGTSVALQIGPDADKTVLADGDAHMESFLDKDGVRIEDKGPTPSRPMSFGGDASTMIRLTNPDKKCSLLRDAVKRINIDPDDP